MGSSDLTLPFHICLSLKNNSTMYYMFVYDEVIKKMDGWTDVMTFK